MLLDRQERRGTSLAQRWRGTAEEWGELVGACMLACARHHPHIGEPDARCACAVVLVDTQFLQRLLYVRRTNGQYLQEIEEARRVARPPIRLARQTVPSDE